MGLRGGEGGLGDGGLGSFCIGSEVSEGRGVNRHGLGGLTADHAVFLEQFQFAVGVVEIAAVGGFVALDAVDLFLEDGISGEQEEVLVAGFDEELGFEGGGAAEVPGGEDELIEEHGFEGAFGTDVIAKAFDEVEILFTLFGTDEGVFRAKAVGEGVAGGPGFPFGSDGAVGHGSIGAGGIGPGLGGGGHSCGFLSGGGVSHSWRESSRRPVAERARGEA